MDPDISAVAALIGDPTRARMLWALMGGLARPAGELAMSANVAPQTASAHLSKLLQGKLLRAEAEGRHRYYCLASPEIAAALEALATVAPRTKIQILKETEKSNPLRFARTCYSHFAGTLAVQINDAFAERRFLVLWRDKEYRLTREGERWFKELGIDLGTIKSRRSALARPCLDWSERRHHLAGTLGTALLQRFFELKWVVRIDKTRALRVTSKGQEQLGKLLGIDFKH